MCVYACASEPVPNESFTGSSTSGHSSSQEETVSMCLCVCITVYLHTQIHSSGRFPAGVSRDKNDQLLTLSKKKKINVCLSTTLLTFLGIFTQQQLICMLHELQLSIIRNLNFLYQCPIRNQISLTPPAPLSYLESLHSHALSLFPWAMNS